VLDIHRRTGYLLLTVLLVQVLLISLQINTSSGTKLFQATVFGVFSQLQLGASKVFGGVRGVWDGYFDLRNVKQENDRLKDQVSQLELQLQLQQALARRGAELEQMLQLRQTTSLKTLAASVIAGDATGYFKTVTIDRGSSNGLQHDMAVISSRGVVGRIVETPSIATAKVQLLIDRSTGAGGIIERSGVGGFVQGTAVGDPPLRMDYVTNLADVKVGDRVVTSGIEGMYPQGFLIGHVETVTQGAGLHKEIRIRPVVDFRALQSVLVVLDRPTPATASPTKAPSTTASPAPTPPAAAPPVTTPPATGTPGAGPPASASPTAGSPAAAAPRTGGQR